MSGPSGPSGGAVGHASLQQFDAVLYRSHPEMTRQLATIGRHPRAGYDRSRWASVNWEDYRAHVGIPQARGPWTVLPVESRADGLDAWISEADGLPHVPGWYTALTHETRGLVMSDLPAEIAGALPFLDRAAARWPPARPGRAPLPGLSAAVLVGGLGLGIIPAWLLANTGIWRLDVVEIDPDIIALITGDQCALDQWAASSRLHVYQGDVHTWWPADGMSCALHRTCALRSRTRWDAAWWDIWDTISPENLPSMRRLHRRFGRRVSWQMSWERAECEAMLARGQTLPHPGLACTGALETGY